MSRFRDLPIRAKLTGIILLVSTLTLIAAAVVIISYESGAARDRLVTELHGLAELIGVNSQAALEFSDPEAATENLLALKSRPTLISAAIYNSKGEPFAVYRRAPESPIAEKGGEFGERFGDGYLEVFHAIGPASEAAGTVYLRTDLAPLDVLIKRYTVVIATMFGALLLASLILANLLQRGVSAPILTLAEVAKAITERRDYSLRARKHGEDEIGTLTDTLNQMLAQIEQQHADLQGAYSELEQRHEELQQEAAERQRAEERVRALNADLEQRVAARTSQLQAANQELESFSYSVSHDLRSPLRGIDGFTRILEDEYGSRLDDEGRRLISVVRKNCQAMGQLIDDLLAFSRLGRKPLQTAQVDMSDVVSEVLNELENIPGDDMPAVTVEPLPTIECDRALIRQVWFNLISNAAKFSSRERAPRIRIWAEPHPSRMVFAISDNGVGFDMAYYDKLFGVFQRLHGAQEFPGTGVGLATIKRIISRHGGQVWAKSKLNEGATFYFDLPSGAPNA